MISTVHDDPPFAGRSALVTGGGSGIGLACARELVAAGAAVVLSGRTPERLATAADRLRAELPDATVAVSLADVADEHQVEAAVGLAEDLAGGLAVVVAAAGTASFGPIVTTGRDEWDAVMATNVTGVFLAIKHAAPAMVDHGGGSIVAISSVASPRTHRFLTPYAVSKAAVDSLVANAADELGPVGVRVNAVRPGLVPTDLSSPLAGTDEIRDDYLAQMPLGRLGTEQDVASLVRFLAGPESAWITGESISVDGGHHLRRGPDVESSARAIFGDAAVDGRP
jgi:NAD(P)-dependent dehydrogenase (short-subunit alcohol dehydrogenase family)